MIRSFHSLTILLVCLASQAAARTWQVAQDGSGDYEVIQEAVDASASGDTILVGPGWYEEYRQYTYPGGEYSVYVNIALSDLTILGAGADVTIIGPREDGVWGDGDKCRGLVTPLDDPTGQFQFDGITICHVPWGIELASGLFVLNNSRLRNCYGGMLSFSRVEVHDCEFFDIRNIGFATNIGSHDVVVKNCVFSSCYVGFITRLTSNVEILNCQILNCSDGGIFDACSGRMVDSKVLNSRYSGISFFGTGDFEIKNNEFAGGWYSLLVSYGGDNLVCEDNIFSGAEKYCIGLLGDNPSIHKNHILRDSGFAVFLDGWIYGETEHIDMSNNYWGTTEPDSIAAWISDGNDPDEYAHPMGGFVDFVPYADGPLPAEKKSLGGIRSMYR